MENKNISQIAFERIQKEGIKPLSRKIFSIKRVIFWVVVISSLIIGAITFAVILSSLFNNDWSLYGKFGFNFILRTLPYFWFISLILFIILGDYYYRKTLLGYRRSFIVVIGFYLTSTIIFGSIFYVIGLGSLIEESFENNPSSYRNILLNRNEFWSHPEDGLLSGKITQVRDGEIEILDRDGFIWIINIQNSDIKKNVNIVIGQKIKIIGDSTGNSLFNADQILPWISFGLIGK